MKKWAYFFITLLISFSVSANCRNFHGQWFGTCSNDNVMDLKIVQESCESINFKGRKLTIGKGHIETSRNISGRLIEEKEMASLSFKKRKLTIHSLVTVTKSPGLFYVDISKKSFTKKDDDTLIYTVIGKKVETQETKIGHADYSWSCFLRKSR